PRGARGGKIDALLLAGAADDAEDRGGGGDRQPRVLLQRGFIDRLAALVVSVVVGRDVGIVHRVEELRVDAVRDAPEIRAALTQEALEALPEERGEDLLGVPLADDRVDDHRIHSARHQILYALVLVRYTEWRQ